MSARVQAVAVVAEALTREHAIAGTHQGSQGAAQVLPEDLVLCVKCGWMRVSDYSAHLAEAVVAALEADMGLTEEKSTHPVFVQRKPLEMVPNGIFGMSPARDLLFIEEHRLVTRWTPTQKDT